MAALDSVVTAFLRRQRRIWQQAGITVDGTAVLVSEEGGNRVADNLTPNTDQTVAGNGS